MSRVVARRLAWSAAMALALLAYPACDQLEALGYFVMRKLGRRPFDHSMDLGQHFARLASL